MSYLVKARGGIPMLRVIRCSVLVLLLVAVALPGWGGEAFHLTILHTNDLHGMMAPHGYQAEGTPFADEERELGGMARLATAIRQFQAESDHCVVVDCGDIFTRGPWHEKWFGEPEIEAMNLMGYDMLVVGNNELKPIWGDIASEEMMLSLMRRSRFPWLSANLTLGEGPPPGCDALAFVEGMHPFIVRTFGRVRVGFLGLTCDLPPDYDWLKGWTIGDPVAAAKRWVPFARRYCDVLIVVMHIGSGAGSEIAAEVDGIDAMVGGHSHEFLSPPLMLKSPSGREVPMVMAGELGVVLGVFDLEFEKQDDGAWQLTSAKSRLVPIDSSFTDDPAVQELLDRYLTPVAALAAP
jgi:2',3'-cyclic-nucleotide 2'-phosphodiesterase (5'-nucleotidase family)